MNERLLVTVSLSVIMTQDSQQKKVGHGKLADLSQLFLCQECGDNIDKEHRTGNAASESTVLPVFILMETGIRVGLEMLPRFL